jgi:O-antigen ligase
VAIGAHVVDSFSSSRRLGIPTEFKIVAAIMACGFISIPSSMWPSGSLDTLTNQLGRSVIVFVLLGRLLSTVFRLRVMFVALAVSALPLAIAAVKAYSSGAIEQGRIEVNAGGVASNPNDLALMLCLALPLTVALALHTTRTLFRFALWGVTGLSVIAIVMTFSRGAFVTLLLEVFLLATLHSRRRSALIGLAIVVCLGVGLFLAPSGYSDRLETILSVESDPTGSSQQRWADIVAAAEYSARHPIVGAGIGQSTLALNEARGALWVAVHNVYLIYSMDLGLPGLVLFIALLVACYRTARRVENLTYPRAAELRSMAMAVRISLAGFALAALFYPIAYHFPFYMYGGLSVALKTIATREVEAAQA